MDTTDSTPAILRTEKRGQEQAGVVPSITLQGHTDEVWHVQWSHCGHYLATGSKDKSAIIWKLKSKSDPLLEAEEQEYSVVHTLADHPDEVMCVAWSKDDRLLLTCSKRTIFIWDVASGIRINALVYHVDDVLTLSWLPDDSGFVSGGRRDSRIVLWDRNGRRRATWRRNPIREVTSVHVTPDGMKLLAIGHPWNENEQQERQDVFGFHPRLVVWDLSTKDMLLFLPITTVAASSAVTKDSGYVLINGIEYEESRKDHAEILLVDLVTGQTVALFAGHQHEEFELKGCFGGADEELVLSGAEDGKIWIWDRYTSSVLQVIDGHGHDPVNSVDWNPTQSWRFATASDDHTVRVWDLPSEIRESWKHAKHVQAEVSQE